MKSLHINMSRKLELNYTIIEACIQGTSGGRLLQLHFMWSEVYNQTKTRLNNILA